MKLSSAFSEEGKEKGSLCVLKSLWCGIDLSVWFAESLQQPRTVLEALQQRLDKYRAAAAQAKASGDDRKGRMHDRIAKVKLKCGPLQPAEPFELVLLLKTFSRLK